MKTAWVGDAIRTLGLSEAGALPAGALPPVVGFFSAALGGIFDDLGEFGWKKLFSLGCVGWVMSERFGRVLG